eukprot:CAMPEP_0116896788 /NCGR_PEP_ID=MMETSP0467-20121206/5951_1 /TAXON_ID=283647 /ORGANISM="Mesodinium pulex, Strain SPMC105" /LENGTH=77 /DNA_ID=CAMNT_0004568147 /DNA_START=249 /DNA_END=482 /DNA_ORIENTATION=-
MTEAQNMPSYYTPSFYLRGNTDPATGIVHEHLTASLISSMFANLLNTSPVKNGYWELIRVAKIRNFWLHFSTERKGV